MELLYDTRCRILSGIYPPPSMHGRTRNISINCNTNMSVLVERVFTSFPSAVEVKTCSGKSCPVTNERIAPRHVVHITHLPGVGLNEIPVAISSWVNRVGTATCLEKVIFPEDSEVTADVDMYDNALRCVTNVIKVLSDSHSFLKLVDENPERLIEYSTSLQNIRQRMRVNGRSFLLRGVVEFIGGRVAN